MFRKCSGAVMNRNYPAFIIKDGDDFTVFFPDLPGCVTWASSVEDAFDCAREALEGHLAAMMDENLDFPEATRIELAVPNEEDADCVVAKVLVPIMLPGKTVRTNISIDESLLLAIDSVAPNRSSFFTEAARNELSRRRGGSRLDVSR